MDYMKNFNTIKVLTKFNSALLIFKEPWNKTNTIPIIIEFTLLSFHLHYILLDMQKSSVF